MGILDEKGIQFHNKVVNGKIYKVALSTCNDPDIHFISRFRDQGTLTKIIANVDKAISGDFRLIDDPGISTDLDIAFISPTGIEFYDRNGQEVVGTLPLEIFREIIFAWKLFLLTVPFDGSEV
jgi:hypothetical protein